MIPAFKFARLSCKRQVYWLLQSLDEIQEMPNADRMAIYDSHLRGLIPEQRRLSLALEAQWMHWSKGIEVSQAQKARRELEELLKQLCGAEPSDWDIAVKDFGGFPAEVSADYTTGLESYLGLYLDRVRSPFNIGSIFRSAAAFGVSEVCLHNHCPDLWHPRAQRTAMGAVELVPARRCDWPADEVHLSELPWVALETPDLVCEYLGIGATTTQLDQFCFPTNGGLLLVGEEEHGLRPELLSYCARKENRRRGGGLLFIPMPGRKKSLNLGVAAAIALQRWAEVLT